MYTTLGQKVLIGVPQSVILWKVKSCWHLTLLRKIHTDTKLSFGFFYKPTTKFYAFQWNQLGHLLRYHLYNVNISSMEIVENLSFLLRSAGSPFTNPFIESKHQLKKLLVHLSIIWFFSWSCEVFVTLSNQGVLCRHA